MRLSDVTLHGTALLIISVVVVAYFRAVRSRRVILDPTQWINRLRPIRFRRFQPGDLEQCLELYRLNEPGRFPPGGFRHYFDTLSKQDGYFLVVEDDDRIIATGGLDRVGALGTILCFGLVHPDYQGRGIGTTMLFARLALLKPSVWIESTVMIFAVEKSIAFYERFGFNRFDTWSDPAGCSHPAACLTVTQKSVREVRRLLQQQGVEIPQEDIPEIAKMRSEAPKN